MTETRSDARLGVGALVALPIVCCVGLALLVGAGLGVAAVAWIGGLALGMAALAVAVAVVAVRARPARRCVSRTTRGKGAV
jgi:hypothetical protein